MLAPHGIPTFVTAGGGVRPAGAGTKASGGARIRRDDAVGATVRRQQQAGGSVFGFRGTGLFTGWFRQAERRGRVCVREGRQKMKCGETCRVAWTCAEVGAVY